MAFVVSKSFMIPDMPPVYTELVNAMEKHDIAARMAMSHRLDGEKLKGFLASFASQETT